MTGNEASKNRLFVRNLDLATSDNEFLSYFQRRYGVDEVKNGHIVRERNGRSKGFGFVSFANTSTVENVVSEKNHTIDGKRVFCKFANPKNAPLYQTPSHLRQIYVGNLGTDITIQELKNYFSNFGDIESTTIVCDDNARSLGYGFIEFRNSSTIDSIQESRPHVINDREIQTTRCYPRDTLTQVKKPSTVLYVMNYHPLDENVIENYFTTFGNITLVSRKMIRPQKIKFMEIQFEDYDCVDVICLADGHIVNGHQIGVLKHMNTEDHIQNTPILPSSTSYIQVPSAPQLESQHQFTPTPPTPVVYSEQPSYQQGYRRFSNTPVNESENRDDDCNDCCIIL